MKSDSRNLSERFSHYLNLRLSLFFPLLLFSLFPHLGNAYIEHHKNTLIDGRASTMGGAYHALSDDAAGCYYNPAGTAFAPSDSISGSAKVFNIGQTTYKKTIGSKNWVRKNENLLPNFFGMIKKMKSHTFGLSYAVPDSVVEHQDQVYTGITEVSDPIDIYGYNLHTDDTVTLIGPTYSYQMSEKLSFGLTLYYYYRVKREIFHYIIEYADNTDETRFSHSVRKDRALKPKLGLMYNFLDQFSVGLSFSTIATRFSNETQYQIEYESKGGSNNVFSSYKIKEEDKNPYEFNLGLAWFRSHNFLISSDIDYYMAKQTTKVDVVNFSLGTEYYINDSHALRAGFYTNYTNNKPVSGVTYGPHTSINMYGITSGYTNFNKDSSVTIGASYATGSGKTQPYGGDTSQRDIERYQISFITSATYGF